MSNEYAYKLAKAIVWPDLSVKFAADVLNGNVQGVDIWDDVCSLVGGWCNDTVVFLAWDKMGRPDEWEYMQPDYGLERDPERRRAMVANARISAMADVVADALSLVVDEIIENALGGYTESYLVKPDGR